MAFIRIDMIGDQIISKFYCFLYQTIWRLNPKDFFFNFGGEIWKKRGYYLILWTVPVRIGSKKINTDDRKFLPFLLSFFVFFVSKTNEIGVLTIRSFSFLLTFYFPRAFIWNCRRLQKERRKALELEGFLPLKCILR